MDVILSGRRLTAQEALAAGLVSRVVAREAWLEEPKRLAREIAAKGPVATRLAKESVNRAYETTLQAGLEAERRALYLAFASEDAKEGLTAFTRSATLSSGPVRNKGADPAGVCPYNRCEPRGRFRGQSPFGDSP
jgi:enoyl-CoA hydratase/carnithine racemase